MFHGGGAEVGSIAQEGRLSGAGQIKWYNHQMQRSMVHTTILILSFSLACRVIKRLKQ
jgi:hypothetical protein